MKVKELIELLQAEDPEMPMYVNGYVSPKGFLASKRKQRNRRYASPSIFASVHPAEVRKIMQNKLFVPALSLDHTATYAGFPIYFGSYFEGKSGVAFGDLNAAITIIHKDFKQDDLGDITGRFGLILQNQMYHVAENFEELGL